MSRTPKVAIIGSGFAGIAVAVELKRAGFDDLVMLERSDDIGGVWRENTYPGAACDVPSPYYSYSFAPNPAWPRRFAPQPAILEYLRDVADRFDVRRHVRCGAGVASASYDDQAGRWQITLEDGEQLSADVLVPAVGQLSRPSMPRIEGLDSFEGPSFHSAQWDHSVDLTGKRVAVIGTGASAIQFVPELQKQVKQLTVFQRTAPYLLPRPDTGYKSWHTRAFEKVPALLTAERLGWIGFTETLGIVMLRHRALSRAVLAQSRFHMKRQTAATPGLFEKIWPSYPIGCKRVLFSDDYLPALTQPNVDLVTDAIEAITPTGVRTAGGREHQVDAIVYGTGFTATDFLAPLHVTGRGGKALREDAWAEGARAYLGVAVPEFPNLFLMYGPNTNLGFGSIIAMLEAQAGYIRQAVEHLAASDAALTVRPDVEQAWDDEMQSRLTTGVWSHCTSWYTLPNGRIPTNWPDTVTTYKRRVERFDAGDYEPVGA